MMVKLVIYFEILEEPEGKPSAQVTKNLRGGMGGTGVMGGMGDL